MENKEEDVVEVEQENKEEKSKKLEDNKEQNESNIKEKIEKKEKEKEEENEKTEGSNNFLEEEMAKEEALMKKAEEEKYKKVEMREEQKYKDAFNIAKKRKRKKIIVVFLCIFILLALIFSTIFALLNVNNYKIDENITISGLDVSGLSKEEAILALEDIYNEKKQNEIILKYGEYISNINPTIIEVDYKIEEAVDEAYLIGKNENIFMSNFEILSLMIFGKDITVDMTLNEEVATNLIKDIGSNLPGIVVEASYVIEAQELVITEGTEGIYVDIDTFLETIKGIFNDLNIKEKQIDIPTIVKQPDEIDIDKIHGEIYKEVKDAYFVEEPFAIYTEVSGVDFDVELAKNIVNTSTSPYKIPLIITEPEITIAELGAEAFPEQISVFTTRYDPSDYNRTTNLELASNSINGIVLLPGETFSYNQALGQRTVAAGYKSAKIYSAGEVIDGLGGGICQISTTLYNAVLMADLEIIERKNHQFVTSYASAGRDATVVYGAIDFQFKNTREYPIKIISSTISGVSKVEIMGINEELYTYSFSTKTISVLPYTTIYEEDSTMPVGTEKVKQAGANGLITETYMTKSLDGKVVETKFLSKDTYTPMTRIVVKGTAAVEQQEVPKVEEQPVSESIPDNQDSIIGAEDENIID